MQNWLNDWIEYHNINSEADAERALSSPYVLRDLEKAAVRGTRKQQKLIGQNRFQNGDYSIVAGRGIDLSGQLDCKSDHCRIRQVDELFGRVWHYFDRIIVEDFIASEFIHKRSKSIDERNKQLLSHMKVMLYLRSIGAADLVEFQMKPTTCYRHWNQHAAEAGLERLAKKLDIFAIHLLKHSKIEFTSTPDGGLKFRLNHPLINPPFGGIFGPEEAALLSKDLRYEAAMFVARVHLAHLTTDAVASNKMGASLGAVNPIHDLFLRSNGEIKTEDVILNLKLPILEGLTTWDLISIRKEEGQYFANFRDALVKATKERLKTSPSMSAYKLAEEIRLDMIQPELNSIEARLKAAQNTLAKKSSVALVLSSLTTTCGILAGADPMLAIGAGTTAAVSCAGTASWKYLDDLKDISLSGMFFLWRAIEHKPH